MGHLNTQITDPYRKYVPGHTEIRKSHPAEAPLPPPSHDWPGSNGFWAPGPPLGPPLGPPTCSKKIKMFKNFQKFSKTFNYFQKFSKILKIFSKIFKSLQTTKKLCKHLPRHARQKNKRFQTKNKHQNVQICFKSVSST